MKWKEASDYVGMLKERAFAEADQNGVDRYALATGFLAAWLEMALEELPDNSYLHRRLKQKMQEYDKGTLSQEG